MMMGMEMKTSINEETINEMDFHLFKKKYEILSDLLNPKENKQK